MEIQGNLTRRMFNEYIAANIKNYLPEHLQDAEFVVTETVKNNGVVQSGIRCHRPGNRIDPIVYTDAHYLRIQQGEPLAYVMEHIAETIKSSFQKDISLSMDIITDYEVAKKYLSVRVIKTAANYRKLSELPHRTVEDLAMYYVVKLPQQIKGEGAAFCVNNGLLKSWNVTEEQLHEDAIKNERECKSAKLVNMAAVIMEPHGIRLKENLLDEEQLPEDYFENNFNLFVLSNQERINGAAMMMIPEVMEKVGKLLPKGFYIIPSSTHEVMIMAKDESKSSEELGKLVREVNGSCVSRDEVLSDRVYEYDREKGRIVTVPDSVKTREQEMAR